MSSTMTEPKLVKVDNWGIFFLQRLKHFFNRTDYCDLTLQFQDNAQLKVHRLVLSACTEYFEVLERTCEMYEDCLVMPDDLQADVVVPVINFMYTGQLEFKMELLEGLYQTSLVMKMPVLSKLLESHRILPVPIETETETSHSYSSHPNTKHLAKSCEKQASASSSNETNHKRSYGKAFHSDLSFVKYRKLNLDKSDFDINNVNDLAPNTMEFENHAPTSRKQIIADPRPTRYELPEELEVDNLFDNSFTNISYTSKPLMVHPETTKRYPPKRTGIFEDPSTSKRFIHGQSTMDIVECKKISVSDQMFEDDPSESICHDQDRYPHSMPVKDEPKDSNKLFDQILHEGSKVTIETKGNKQADNLDHAKIISEVLKKYPHLVKSNKNIKLKILNTPAKKKSRSVNSLVGEKEIKQKNKVSTSPDYSYESKILDSKEAAKLIALGAENINGPWICLLCGAPGKAIHFSSYYKFRRHLVDVHNEKPVLNICEYCGHKSMKRNYLLHHLYTKHGVEPPPHYRFPKCNICNYVALTEGFLVKHKLTHLEKHNFPCHVCPSTFSTANQLIVHLQVTGHKYGADKKANLQCLYCFKSFSREGNLYAHLRTQHKESARNDGIIDISDDEKPEVKENKVTNKTPTKQEIVKYEVPITYENEFQFDADEQYQIQQQPDGNIQVVSKKPRVLLPTVKHKILNSGFGTPANKTGQKSPLLTSTSIKLNEFSHNSNNLPEEIVMIDNDEYIVKDNRLLIKKEKTMNPEDFTMSSIIDTNIEDSVHNIIPTSSVEFTNLQTTTSEHHKMIVNKSSSISQPIQIVVSNEEEYKALMASNPSIIFEDGDTNKTLTVLTAPHDNNTIDLNNTPSNGMMIIPQDFPLNVSQAVSGNNSNIVVVYSHPVDNQNKEYQLIASENLEAQFVTSTAILTQSYETVTTSASIINPHELHTPVEDAWPNNIPQNIASNTELEVPMSTNQVNITPVENQQGTIANLEEVQLPPINSDAVVIHQSADINQTNVELNTQRHNVNNVTVTNTEVIGSNETGFVETVHSVPTPNLNGDSSDNTINAEESCDQPIQDLNNVNELVPQDNTHLENISVAHEEEGESSKQQTLDDTKFIQNVINEESSESETIENISKAIQTASADNPVTVETETHLSMVTESTNVEEVISTNQTNEKILNLASEWSDDEETSTQEQSASQEENTVKQNVTTCEAMETDSQSELEESIENIKQEIENQLSRSVQEIAQQQSAEPLSETENVFNESQDEMIAKETKPENNIVVLNASQKSPVKISSLLNDWEDNDCQEVATDVKASIENENKENTELNKDNIVMQDMHNTGVEVKGELVNCKETHNKKPELKAGDNIQSLVSDWVEDDDDEEIVKN